MSKHWTLKEHETLSINLVDGIALSTLQSLIPTRTQGAIKVQASKLGFRSHVIDEETILIEGIKRRYKGGQGTSTKAEPQPSDEYVDASSDEIIPLLPVVDDGYEVNQMAINLLKDRGLPFEPKIIYELTEYLIRSKVKGIECQEQLILQD